MRAPRSHARTPPSARVAYASLALGALSFAPAAPSFALEPVARPLPAAMQEFPVLDAQAPPGTGAVRDCAPAGVEGSSRCGVFRVLEDRREPSGPTIDIAFVVLEALDGPRREPDAVLPLPGGPGQAFTAFAGAFSGGLRALRQRRDVLLVDVRGVGRSGELACDVPFPRGVASRFGTPFPLDHVVACRDALARRVRLDRYTTAASVDDLEELRAWLGYPAFNLNGGSYGTRVAQVYMRRHPRSVRTAVLNGVAPVSEPLYVQHAALLQRALDRLLDECAADAACAASFPDARADVARVLDRFANGPVEVSAGGGVVDFTAGDLSYALRGLLYARGAELPALLSRAAAGEVQPLADYYLERTGWVGEAGGLAAAGYHFSVLCAEDIAVLTDEQVVRATAGTFMGAHLIDAYRAVCDVWPEAEMPPEHWRPVQSDIPTLLLSGGRDPVTPPEGAEAVARGLANSLHVVVPNGGHGVGGPCVASLVLELVRTASVEGLDPSCIEAAPPTPFVRPGG